MHPNLLLVDDEPNISQALKRALRGEAFNVYTATSGEDAITLMQERSFEVVVSDYRMPEMNGVEFLTRVRENHPATIRMMLSGQADLEAVISAVNSGNIYKFLTKPWNNDHIRAEIRQAMDRASAKQTDARTGWLSRTAFIEQLGSQIDQQATTVVVGEILNNGSIQDVLTEGFYAAFASEISQRCGNKPTTHLSSLDNGLFAFALSSNEADHTIRHIHEQLNQEMNLGYRSVQPIVSLGFVACNPDTVAEDAISQAISALTTDPNHPSSGFYEFKESSETQIHLRHSLEHDMAQALKANEFFIQVQPQVNSNSLKIVGGEVLVRWQHSTHGLISPLQFIDLAEQTGFIQELGNWVVQQALTVARKIHSIEAQGLRIGVNVSPRQFIDSKNAPWLQTLHKAAATEPQILNHLELEVTESSVLDDPETAAETLRNLRSLGLSLALDDFGTGHSSLAQLSSLPIDVLKLDRSLLLDVADNARSRTVLDHLTKMAADLGFDLIAEGIDSHEQTQICRGAGCQTLQGFAFHKPMSVDDFLMNVLEDQLTTPEG